MKKLIALFLALVMVLSLAACGGEKAEAPKADAPKADAPAADGVVTIKLMMSQTQQPGVSAAVEAFNKAYEGKYTCEADYLAFDNVFETLEILMSSQSSEYDVFAADGPNIAAYAKRGYLTPLTPYLTEESPKTGFPFRVHRSEAAVVCCSISSTSSRSEDGRTRRQASFPPKLPAHSASSART